MHRLLERQLKKTYREYPQIPSEWMGFIQAVDDAYAQADADHALVERSLDLTSQEFMEIKQQLESDIAQRKSAEEALRKQSKDLATNVVKLAEANRKIKGAQQEIRANEEMYSTIIEKTGQLVYDYDVASGKIGWFGDVKSILGFSSKEFQKVSIARWARMIHPDDRKKALGLLAKAEKKGGAYNVEYRFKNKRGGYTLMEDSGVFLTGKSGKSYRMLGTMKDITKQNEAEKALRESEKNYRAIFDSANDAFFIHDIKTGAILDVNQKMLDMYGFKSKKEVIGSFVGKLSSGKKPYTLKEAGEFVAKAAKGKPQVFEWHARKRDGTLFWAEVSLKRATLLGTTRILAMAHDITERRNAGQKLKDSELKYRRMAELLPYPLATLNLKGDIVDANPAASKLLGFSKNGIIGKNFRSMVSPESLPAAIKGISNIMRKGKPYPANLRLKTNKGDYLELVVWGIPIETEGKITSIQIVGRDITDEKKAQDALSAALSESVESEKKFRALFETSPDPIFVISRDMKMTMANPAFFKSTGYSEKDVIGKGPRHLLLPQSIPVAVKALARKIRAEKGRPIDLFIRAKDGSVKIIEANASLVKGDKGKVTGFMIVGRDITERKELARRLEDSNRALRDKTKEMGRTISNFAAANRSLLAKEKRIKELEGQLKK